MKSLPLYFRLKPLDRQIKALLEEGVEPKKVARRLKLPMHILRQKIKKLERLGVL